MDILPIPPVITSFNPGETIDKNSVIIWQSDLNASYYSIRIATSVALIESAPNVYRNDNLGNVTSFNLDTAGDLVQYGETYYIRISAYSSLDTEVEGSISNFIVRAMPMPNSPILRSPSNGTVNLDATGSNIQWFAAKNAETYNVKVSSTLANIDAPDIVDATGVISLTQVLPTLTYSQAYYWKVESVNSTGTAISDIWSFTTEANPTPEAFVITNPLEGSINIPLATYLRWTLSTNATGYEVRIASTQALLDNPDVTEHTGLNQYIDELNLNGFLTYSKVYYARVTALSASGSLDVETSFTTVDAPPPAAFSLSSPTNGDTDASTTAIALVWQNTTGESTYNVKVASSVVLLNTAPDVIDDTTPINVINYNAAVSLANFTTYYWTIEAVNYQGTKTPATNGPFSFVTEQIGAPSIPIVSVDSLNDLFVKLDDNILWSSTPPADSYKLKIATTEALLLTTPDVYDTDMGSNTMLNIAGLSLIFNTDYYIRVDATNIGGITSSVVLHIKTRPIPTPELFTQLTPTHTQTELPINGTILTWEPSTYAATYSLVCTQRDLDFSNPVEIVNVSELAGTSYALPTLVNDKYFVWRPTAHNITGTTETASGFEFYTASSGAPTPGTITNPTDSSIDVVQNPTITWTAFPNADTYDVYLYKKTEGAYLEVVNISGLIILTHDFTGYYPLDFDGEYKVQVIGTNVIGNAVAESEFTIAADTAPEIPVINDITDPTNVGVAFNDTVTWTSAARTVTYTIEIATSETLLTANAPDIVSATIGPASTSFLLTGVTTALESLTNYFVRVKATNTGGTVISAVLQFQTAPKDSPSNFSILNPVPSSTGINLTGVSLEWSESTGATMYNVAVAIDAGYVSKIADLNVNTLNTILPSLAYNTEYFVKVAATNNNPIPTLAISTFTTKGVEAPGIFSITTPTDTQVDVTLDEAAEWTEASGATSYVVKIAETEADLNDGNYIANTNIGNVRHFDMSGYITEYTKLYFLRIEAINDNPAHSIQTISFTTGAEPIPASAEWIISEGVAHITNPNKPQTLKQENILTIGTKYVVTITGISSNGLTSLSAESFEEDASARLIPNTNVFNKVLIANSTDLKIYAGVGATTSLGDIKIIPATAEMIFWNRNDATIWKDSLRASPYHNIHDTLSWNKSELYSRKIKEFLQDGVGFTFRDYSVLTDLYPDYEYKAVLGTGNMTDGSKAGPCAIKLIDSNNYKSKHTGVRLYFVTD